MVRYFIHTFPSKVAYKIQVRGKNCYMNKIKQCSIEYASDFGVAVLGLKACLLMPRSSAQLHFPGHEDSCGMARTDLLSCSAQHSQHPRTASHFLFSLLPSYICIIFFFFFFSRNLQTLSPRHIIVFGSLQHFTRSLEKLHTFLKENRMQVMWVTAIYFKTQ